MKGKNKNKKKEVGTKKQHTRPKAKVQCIQNK